MRIINLNTLLYHGKNLAEQAISEGKILKSQGEVKLKEFIAKTKQKYFDYETPEHIKVLARLRPSQIDSLNQKELEVLNSYSKGINDEINHSKLFPFITSEQKTRIKNLKAISRKLTRLHAEDLISQIAAAKRTGYDITQNEPLMNDLHETIKAVKKGLGKSNDGVHLLDILNAFDGKPLANQLTKRQNKIKAAIDTGDRDAFMTDFLKGFTDEDAKQIWIAQVKENLTSGQLPKFPTPAYGIKIRMWHSFDHEQLLENNSILKAGFQAEKSYLSSYKAKQEKAEEFECKHESAKESANRLITEVASLLNVPANTVLDHLHESLLTAKGMNSLEAKTYLKEACAKYKVFQSDWMKQVRAKTAGQSPDQAAVCLQEIKKKFPEYKTYPSFNAILDQMIQAAFTDTPFDSLQNAIKAREVANEANPSDIGGLKLAE